MDFPEWGLKDIEVKIDTGAYGSAIHCHHMEVVKKDGVDHLRFQLLDPDHPEYEDRYYYSREFSDKNVKSSSGEQEHRYALKTSVVIGNKRYRVQFTLTNRSEMRYPVLIGRKFLRKKFLVDVSQKDILKNQKRKK